MSGPNLITGLDFGKSNSKLTVNLRIASAYGPSWMNMTPSHIKSVSEDGVRYTPLGQAPGAESEALLISLAFGGRPMGVLLGCYIRG